MMSTAVRFALSTGTLVLVPVLARRWMLKIQYYRVMCHSHIKIKPSIEVVLSCGSALRPKFFSGCRCPRGCRNGIECKKQVLERTQQLLPYSTMGVLGHFGAEIGKFSKYIENSYLTHLVVQTCFRRVWEDGLAVFWSVLGSLRPPNRFRKKGLKNDFF